MLKSMEVVSTSLVNHQNLQRIILNYHATKSCHLKLSVFFNGSPIKENIEVAFTSGKGVAYILLPMQKQTINAEWKFFDLDGRCVYSCFSTWKTPRDWTIYVMISSHTDIGLHNSQYIQRANSSKFIEQAKKLTDLTRDEKDCDRYKYIMEGTWFWNNYPMDKGSKKARETVKNYINEKNMGICCGVAGNVMQALGLEELCRFAYERKKLEKKWGVKCETMSMIDNNGLPLSIIQPLSDAGYKNIIFSPNQWHPLYSTIWERNLEDDTYPWNPNAGGSGARIDFRYESDMPMLFFWENDNGDRLLVAGSTQYDNSGVPFGIFNKPQPALINKDEDYIPYAEIKTARTLKLLEEKYDFNVWLLPCYADDQAPNLWMQNKIKEWNKKWKYPTFSIVGDPDLPFNILRENFYDKIPVVRGDITGGWYQVHTAIADFATNKYETDRLLPIAEKWSTVATTINKDYKYPKTEFERAYYHLLYNDEHSYGASTYRGRKVHETWLQHRDWVEKAKAFAKEQIDDALNSISSKIEIEEDSIVAFNPTNQNVTDFIETDGGEKYAITDIPKFGYKVIKKSDLNKNIVSVKKVSAPTIENSFYKIIFKENGAIKSIFDKELNKELLTKNYNYGANEFVFTKDNHLSFHTQTNAEFELVKSAKGQKVIIKSQILPLKAEIVQTVALNNHEKKIEIKNQIYHAKDLFNFITEKTYARAVYLAFPFAVENCQRLCHLNGAVAEYAKDVTGHCTDTYMAVHDWCVVQNKNYGVALLTKETQLIEFDHIHSDKSDFGNAGKGSQIFCYLINDWLQMHVSGGSDLNFKFEYAITSYNGDYKDAKIPELAERFITPIQTIEKNTQKGNLPSNEHTFFNFGTNSRFITLKPADDGDGLIARFYGQEIGLPCKRAEKVSIDELPISKTDDRKGFYTCKIKGYKVKNKKIEKVLPNETIPLPIGSHYTGLIDKPKVTSGEKDGQLYLIWGQNREKNLSHYELYRSETPNFKANKKTFVDNVYPEDFVIARYEDLGLKTHTTYYYKVRAVNKNGVKGELSEEFFANTREKVEQ